MLFRAKLSENSFPYIQEVIVNDWQKIGVKIGAPAGQGVSVHFSAREPQSALLHWQSETKGKLHFGKRK